MDVQIVENFGDKVHEGYEHSDEDGTPAPAPGDEDAHGETILVRRLDNRVVVQMLSEARTLDKVHEGYEHSDEDGTPAPAPGGEDDDRTSVLVRCSQREGEYSAWEGYDAKPREACYVIISIGDLDH